MKTHVYSWRLTSDLKSELERAARLRRAPLSAVLEQAARAWLAQNSAEVTNDEETQRQLHAAAEPYIGCIAGDNPRRSEMVREIVREKLQRKYGR
jgi:metal-responsive CopG/Arc/MetJ family transcriptional regulator